MSIPDNAFRLNNPLFIADYIQDDEDDDPNTTFIINLMEPGGELREPGMFGVVISDLIDHIANAYTQVLDRDARDIRAFIVKIWRMEEKAKQKDPKRSQLTGRVTRSEEEFRVGLDFDKSRKQTGIVN